MAVMKVSTSQAAAAVKQAQDEFVEKANLTWFKEYLDKGVLLPTSMPEGKAIMYNICALEGIIKQIGTTYRPKLSAKFCDDKLDVKSLRDMWDMLSDAYEMGEKPEYKRFMVDVNGIIWTIFHLWNDIFGQKTSSPRQRAKFVHMNSIGS